MFEPIVRALALQEHLKFIDFKLAHILKNQQPAHQKYTLLYNHVEKMHAFLKESIVMLKKRQLLKQKIL